MEYLVLYTHQKTKKAKTWHDGVLSVTTANKAVLYDDKKTKLDSMYIKPEAIVKGEQLESDRYFILIEEEKSTVQTIVELVKPVTCLVRIPVRTGLKRKRTGFVPPRLVKQNEGNQLVPHEPSSGETYLELLRKKRASFQNGSANNSDKYCFNSAPHNTETPLFQTPSRQQSFSENFNSIPKISEQTLDYKILSDENASAQSNQFSPWSSYGNKLKSLHSPEKSFLSPGRSLNSPGTSRQICSEINVVNFVKEASPSMDDNNKCLQSPDHTNICLPTKNLISENINFIKNDTIITNVNKNKKSASGGPKPCNETTSEEQNSKRSMTQIMALLGKKKSSPSTLSHDMKISNGKNKSTTLTLSHDIEINNGKNSSSLSTLSHIMELNKEEVEYSNSNNMINQSHNIYSEENTDISDNIIHQEHNKKQTEKLELNHTEITNSKMSPYNNKTVSIDQDSTQYLHDSVRSSQEWSSVKIELSPLTPYVILENQEITEKEMAFEIKDEIDLNNMDFSTHSKVTQDGCKTGILLNNSSEVLSPFHESSEVPLYNKLPSKTTLQGCNETKSSPDEQDIRKDILHGSSELDKNDLFTMDDEHMSDENVDLAVSFDINFSPLSYVSDSDSMIDTAEGQSTVGNTTDLSQPDTAVVFDDGDYSKLENNSTNVCEVNNPIEINMKEQFIDKKSETFQLTKDSFDDSDKNSNPTESGENTNMTPNGCSLKYTENTDITIDDQPKFHLELAATINIHHDNTDIQEFSKSVEGSSSIHQSVDSDMKQEENKCADKIEDLVEKSIIITKLDYITVSPTEQDLSKSVNVKDPDNNEITCKQNKDPDNNEITCKQNKDPDNNEITCKQNKDPDNNEITCKQNKDPDNNEITCKQNNQTDTISQEEDFKRMSDCDILTENSKTTEKQIKDHSSPAYPSNIPNEVRLFQSDLGLPSVGEKNTGSNERESHRINCKYAKDLQTDKQFEMGEKDTPLDRHFPVKSLNDLNFSPDSFHLSDESPSQNTCTPKSIIKDSALCLSQEIMENNSFPENQLYQEKMTENKNNFNHSNVNMNLASENCQQICSKNNFASESASSLKSSDNGGTFQKQNLNEEDNIYMLHDTWESVDQNTSVQECSEKEYYITDNISQTTDKGDNLSQISKLDTALTDSQCKQDNYNNESEVFSEKNQKKHSRHQRKQGKYETCESENFVRGDNSQTCWNNFAREDYSPDYRESSTSEYHLADRYSKRRDFSPKETCSMNKMNKMEPLVQGQSDHTLQHPDDIFAKKNQMMIRPDHEGSDDVPINCQIQNQSDLRCTASEKLESYTMKGSVTSGAVRRKDNQETEPMIKDESFYIDLNEDKPRLKSQPSSSIMFQFQTSPVQFVPNTPEFLKSLKTTGSSQNSSGKSSQEELALSGDTDYLDYDIAESDLKSSRFLTYSNQILQRGSLQQIGEKENQSQILRSTISQQRHERKVKIPLVSAPEDSLAENGDNNSVPRSKSHDAGEKRALFDRNLIQDKSDVDNGCSINIEVVPNISESDSDISSPSLTYWENKLIQRQKCGNIFIKNDQESSQSSLENWESKDKSNYVNNTEYKNSSGPFDSNVTRSSNSVKQNQVQHRNKVRHYDEQDNECNKIDVGGNLLGTISTVPNETETSESDNTRSKWGKYADFDYEDDDFLTFDQSFSVPVVTDQSETPTTSLRPWTKHNDTFNGDKSLVVPEMTDQKEKPVISLGSWTKHNDTFDIDESLVFPELTDHIKNPVISLWPWTKCNVKHGMPDQAEKHTISLQPAKRHSDTFDLSDLSPLDTITESQSFSKYELIHATSKKFQSTSQNNKEQFQPRNISEKQYITPNSQNCNQNTQSGITRTNSPNFSHGNPSRHISEKQYLSPAIPSSRSNRYQITNKHISQSTITRTNSPNLSHGNPSNVESTSVACVTPTDNINTGKKFKCPVPQLTSSILKGTKRNLGSDLQFPSIQEITENSQLVREMEIPTRFTSLSNYKQVFTAALKEHLNIILFDLGVKYHHALSKIDTTSYLPTVPGKENKGTVNSNPVCKCGAPSKMIQVKKSGPNHNRFFYACNAARNSQCKFFQWSDEKGGGHNKKGGIDKQTMSDPTSISTFIRSHHVNFYCDCTFIKKSQENIMTHFRRNTPNWVKQKMGMDITGKKKMYIQLSKKDNSGLYSKDDLWIISRHLDFRPSSTVLCKSTYYGPTSGNEVEIEPIASFCPSNWSNGEKCHAILAGNVSGELSYLVNLEENVTITDVPVLQSLLACNTERSSSSFTAPLKVSENTNIYVPEGYVDEKVEELINQYKLNEDQSTALLRVARMFTNQQKDILLIHGVFGAGKSFLLSVVVVFLVWLFERSDTYTPGVPFPWKLLIASTTNVAVDRILNGLLAIGFEEFVRVGSVKKISKSILPFSVHATGSDSQELKDLQMMLRSGELTTTEKQNVKQSIEKHKLGENKKKLSKVRVVGVTCASCSANTLKDMKFPIVLLDECSQMTEPASMLPVAKFKCQKLVLVGDPKQLDPTIQGSETSTVHGLEQTLFDRITLMGHSPVMLHTQYRCHPYISQVSNSLFYNNILRNGISVEDRDPVMDELPALCFYDVCDGLEINDRDGSFYNDKESQFIMFLIEVLVDRDVDPVRIGVISLYKSQMYKITNLLGSNKNCKELKGVMVSTVDAFQGGERDVIILSCVRTRNVGFIDNEKRTNVALTRAKHHLLIVGNENNLTKNKLWHQIIQQCKDSSLQGLQSADTIRERFKLEPKPTESSQKKKRHHNKQEMLTDDASSSPPMSLTDSCKSSLSTDSPNIQQLVPESVSLEKGDQCSEEMDFQEDLTYRVPGSAGLRQRRKRRKIDPSLLEDDENINSDDEELPNIFNS